MLCELSVVCQPHARSRKFSFFLCLSQFSRKNFLLSLMSWRVIVFTVGKLGWIPPVLGWKFNENSSCFFLFLNTAVTLQFVSHSFLEYHDPTIGELIEVEIRWKLFYFFISHLYPTEDSYQQQAIIDGEAAQLDILDTAGQVEFTAMRDQYMRAGEGFIICYSICDRRSFQEVTEYRKLITRVRLTEDIPLVLVANKLDLQSQRKVTTEEGKALAMQFGCPFYETSAAIRCNVDEVFYTLVREIRQKELQKVRQWL